MKAVRKSDQMVVAIKTLRGFVDAVDMIREVDLVANLHHPNIIRLLDVCRAVETNQRGALVFEYGGPTLCWHPLRPIVATHQTLVRYNVGCKFLFAHQFPNEGAQVSGFCIRVSGTWGPTLQEFLSFRSLEPMCRFWSHSFKTLSLSFRSSSRSFRSRVPGYVLEVGGQISPIGVYISGVKPLVSGVGACVS
jgi:hypothetical protein